MAAQKQLLKLWELNNHRPSERVTLRLECCQSALRHLSLYVLTCQRHQVSSVESYRLLVQQQRMPSQPHPGTLGQVGLSKAF